MDYKMDGIEGVMMGTARLMVADAERSADWGDLPDHDDVQIQTTRRR
jgi:hypothetical protein